MTNILINNFDKLCIDNFNDILSITEKTIKIRTKKYNIIVTGNNLQIYNISSSDIIIIGNIISITKE